MSKPGECSTCGQPLSSFSGEDSVCLGCLWGLGTQNPAASAPDAAASWCIPGHDLLEELSRGGMGVVYKALQHQPKRLVALKMLLPVHCRSEALQDRFRVEASALAQLEHPGIIPLYQFGEVDGIPYFTMKLATGGSLNDRLKAPDGKPSPREAAEWMERLAATLHHAHQRGVLHRDIKPGNILFDEAGQPCLGDFGLAKLMDENADLTGSIHVMGTPCYLPPEVAVDGSKAATTSSDIYSLGAVFYELLTSTPPFVMEGMTAIIRQIIHEMPPAPASLVPGLPRDLEIICMTCLAKEPERRYSSADELADDIRRWLNGDPILARRASGGERLLMWARRKPALAGLSAALVTVAVLGTFLLWRKNIALEESLAATRAANSRAETRAQFLLGSFADSLEDLGRVDLLDQAWSSLGETAAASLPGDSQGALMSAKLLLRWSGVLLTQGRCQESETKAREALKLLPALPPEEALRFEREGKVALAWALVDEGQYEEAAAVIESVRGIIPWKHPGSQFRSGAETDLAQADLIFRQDHANRGPEKIRIALPHAQAALLSAKAWKEAEPESPEAAFTCIRCLRALGRAKYYLQSYGDALPFFTEARDAAALLAAHPAAAARWKDLHADLIGWAGQAAAELGPGKQQEAEKGLTGELAAVQAMLDANPASASLRLRLADCHWALRKFWADSKPELSAGEGKLWVATLSALWRDAPFVRDVRIGLCNAAQAEIPAMLRDGRTADAVVLTTAAGDAAFAEILRRSRDVNDHAGWISAISGISKAWNTAGDQERALKLLAESTSRCARQAAADPGSAPWWQWSQATFLRREADLHKLNQDWQKVLDRSREALQLRVGLLKARWELKSLGDSVPGTYKVVGDVLRGEKRYDEALSSAEEALQCWQDYSQDFGGLDKWLEVVTEASRSACGTDAADLRDRGHALAQRAVTALAGAMLARPPKDPEALNNWEALKALATSPAPAVPKTSSLPRSRSGSGPGPGLPSPGNSQESSSGENLMPALQMGLASAQDLHRPVPRPEGKPGEQSGIRLQLLGIPREILRSITQKPANAMGHQLIQMVSAPTGNQGNDSAQHGLDDSPAPAFLESRTQIVNENVQGIQEPHHGFPACGNQVPALIEKVSSPALRHLITPAQNPEPERLLQPQPLVAEREIVREFIRIGTGNPSHGKGPAILPDPAPPEGEHFRINIITSHHPVQPQIARAAETAAPLRPILSRRQEPIPGAGNRRRTGGPAERPAVARLQQPPLSGGDIQHLLNKPETHRLELAVKVPHHLTAPDGPQPPPETGAQHAILEETAIAHGNRPALGLFGNILQQSPAHSQLSQIIQPLRVPEITGVIRHHRDIIFSGQKAERVHEFSVRSSNMSRPVEPI